MQTIPLNTGRTMPQLGLGTWQLTHETARTVERALELGYRMIDTSSDYGTQPGIGDALRHSGVDRDHIFIVTKVEEDEDAYEATRRNLDEIGIGWSDLVLIHRPPPQGAGEELWEGLIRAREDGLARDIGVSNYAADQIDELAGATGEAPAVNQIEWSPFGWSPEFLEYSRRHGIVVQAYSPLTRATRLDDPTLAGIAERHGRSAAQVLLRWDLQRGVATVPKANREAHLVENLGALEFSLSDQDMQALDRLNEHYSSLGSLPYL